MSRKTAAGYAVLLLALVLMMDVSWCGYDATSVNGRAATAFSTVSDDGVEHVECKACICSGTALMGESSMRAPAVPITGTAPPAVASPLSRPESVEIPPDERV